MAGMTEPLEVVLRSELVTLVMAKVVVVAFVVVAFPATKLVPTVRLPDTYAFPPTESLNEGPEVPRPKFPADVSTVESAPAES
jgi:hypothetical protein